VKVFRYKNRIANIIVPIMACISIFCFTPLIKYSILIMGIPIIFIFIGVYYFYRQMTFGISIAEDQIIIGNKTLQWDKIEKGILIRQIINEDINNRRNTTISLLYHDEKKEQKTISITPGKMEKSKELNRLIKEKIEVVKLEDINKTSNSEKGK
jgi:hypothetical protein